MSVKSTPRFVALDSWRGICACLVAMFHLTRYTNFLNIDFIGNAFLFVDFFFVLSGFVISSNYSDRLNNGFGVINFMILRFGRVYPMHLFTLLLFIAVYIFVMFVPILGGASAFGWNNEDPSAIITNLLLIQSLGLHDSLTWNFPSWSISAEYYTYLFFALAIIVFKRHIISFMFIVLIFCPIFIAILSPYNMDVTYDFGFFRCVYGFGLGVLLWWLYGKYLHRQRFWVHENKYTWTLVELFSIAIAVVFVTYSGRSIISVLAPVVFSIVIYAFIYEAGLVSRILLSRGFVVIGTLSYSIYMLHAFIIFMEIHVFAAIQQYADTVMFRTVRGTTYLGSDYFQSGAVYVGTMLLIIACAFLTYRGIEAPGRGFFRRIVRARIKA